MGVYIDGERLLIIKEPKAIHFDLPIEVNNELKHKIIFII